MRRKIGGQSLRYGACRPWRRTAWCCSHHCARQRRASWGRGFQLAHDGASQISNSAGVNSSRSSSGLFRKYCSIHASAPAKRAIALSVVDNLSSEGRYHFTVTVSVQLTRSRGRHHPNGNGLRAIQLIPVKMSDIRHIRSTAQNLIENTRSAPCLARRLDGAARRVTVKLSGPGSPPRRRLVE